MKKLEIKVDWWEADEYVLSFNGKVQGYTLSWRDAQIIKNYLESVDFSEIIVDLSGPKGFN